MILIDTHIAHEQLDCETHRIEEAADILER